MMAAANPAIIIPMIISAVVEFNLAEKNIISVKASSAPKKEAVQISQELLIQSVKPSTAERKITKATPKPEAEVIPSTDGSASGFLNNSCKSNPLTGSAIPLSTAAKVLGSLKSNISFLAVGSSAQSKSEIAELPIFRFNQTPAPIRKINKITVILKFNLLLFEAKLKIQIKKSVKKNANRS